MFTAHFARIAELALKQGLPVVSGARSLAEAGALVTYGPDYAEGYRRAAVYVDKILRGEPPATLPVDQTTTFELAVKTRTARALGIAIPPSLASRADYAVE